MAKNPFTTESRDVRVHVGIPGLCDQLRTPESLRWLIFQAKPAHLSVGDWLLKAALDEYLIALIVDGRYRDVESTLVSLFDHAVTVVAGSASDRERS